MSAQARYVGRFAPSPTGLLHLGSLLTAIASYLDARCHGGDWLVRMEDLDPPREVDGAAVAILQTLEAFGLYWDGEVVYQSQRHHLYEAALAELRQQQLVYPCICSRRTVFAEARSMGADGAVYGGRCSRLVSLPLSAKPPAWRIRVRSGILGFEDGIVGWQQQDVADAVGDFVLKRADGFWAYQLAVVVDDGLQGINHVIRGQDLLWSTPRQIYLQQMLGFPVPKYAHLPLLVNKLGQKWSKQTHAPALDMKRREALLREVLVYLGLGQAPAVDNLPDLLQWAVTRWRMPCAGIQSICTEPD